MKIDGTGQTGGAGEVNRKNARSDAPKTSFDNVLKEAMGGKQAEVHKVSGPVPTSPILPVQQAGKPMAGAAVNALEAMLDELEIYRNSLANGDIPESHLKRMGQSLNDRKDNLVSLIKAVDDPELKGMLSEAAAVVVNESSRLNRAV